MSTRTRTRLDDLGREIAREQDALRAKSTVRAEVRARLDALDIPKVQRRAAPRTVALAGTAVAGALAAAIALWVLPSKPKPAVLAVTIGEDATPGTTGTWVEAPTESAVAMRFSDGTQVDVAPSSRARIAELLPNGAHLLLENGLAQVHVQRRPNAAWRVSAGPFAVKVTGTQFDVRWTPEQDAFELDLHEGHVEISGCVFGQNYELNAGQRAVASCRQGRLNVGAQSEVHSEASTSDATGADEALIAVEQIDQPELPPPAAGVSANLAPAVAPSTTASRASDGHSRTTAAQRRAAARAKSREIAVRWRSLAEAGRYADALEAVRGVGFLAACKGADASDLLLLSDLARYGRDYDAAAQALHLLRQRFGGSRHAAQAAFALGKLQFDQDGSYSEAAWWFRTYLREQPGGALAREASGRLLEATSRSGDSSAARELAAQYLRDYPNGPHAALANALRSDR